MRYKEIIDYSKEYWEAKEAEVFDFVSIMTHGYMVVDETLELKPGIEFPIYHFVGYRQLPTIYDYESLLEEMQTDPDFGLDMSDKKIILAPPEIVEQFRG